MFIKNGPITLPMHLVILVLDDNPSDAELMIHAIRKAGFFVHSTRVETEVDFRRLLDYSIDLILIDNRLPAMNALRAMEIIHESQIDVPAVIVSGTLDEAEARALLDMGAWDYVMKDRLFRLGMVVKKSLEMRMRFSTLKRATEIEALLIELTNAYDETIAGWARALDLRDKETEGHSQRVTENTVRLARAMGISEREIVHVRRGALLHDIGKVGIPDSILLKPGPLTAEEFDVMQRHPQYAYELLYPIAHLRPALDIPYCHHEKWDGTGYPRGLKGEAIPLCARLFSIVDVWDALTNERPYRDAWEKSKAALYIRGVAGHMFDPDIVRDYAHVLLDGRAMG